MFIFSIQYFQIIGSNAGKVDVCEYDLSHKFVGPCINILLNLFLFKIFTMERSVFTVICHRSCLKYQAVFASSAFVVC